MTDEEIDRMVRAADPYRPVAGVDEARAALLEEITSMPTTRSWRMTPLLAAAAVTAVVAVSAALIVNRPATSATVTGSDAANPSATAGPAATPGSLLGGHGDRLLLRLSGADHLKVVQVKEFAGLTGTVSYRDDARTRLLSLDWRDAADYADVRQARTETDTGTPEPVSVDGWDGEVITNAEHDWEVLLRPRDGVWVTIRSSGAAWTRAEFDAAVAGLTRVDAREWAASLPADTVTEDRAATVLAAEVLPGVPLPAGWTADSVRAPGVFDPISFKSAMVNVVGCGWVDEWSRARRAGDTAAVTHAVDVLRGSDSWPVSASMKAQFGYLSPFPSYVDRVGGDSPESHLDEPPCMR